MSASLQSLKHWVAKKQEWEYESSKNVILELIHVNVRSLHKHWHYLQFVLTPALPSLHIFILTEISISEIDSSKFFLDGFQSFSLCREHRKGGGVMVFVRSGWLCDRLSLTFNEAEVVALTADSPNGEFLVCAVYRPPNKNIALFLDELSAFLNKHSNKQIILAGDFNIDITDTSKTGVNDYLTLLAGYGFENQIQDFTREEILSDRLTQTCIDHISTRTPKLDAFGWVVKEKVADHYFTVLVISGDNRLPPVEPELEN